MHKPWTLKTSSFPVEAIPRVVGWRDAQRFCNFVLMEPQNLPADLRLTAATVRPEAPPGRGEGIDESVFPLWTRSNRASHRSQYSGTHRSLRIKQFLYDYAPPAFDHPGLWESQSVAPFLVGNDIGWIGTDFKGRQAVTATIDRTTLELAVLSGIFSDRELQEIVRGCAPVDPDARETIRHISLAELCYQRRHRESPIAVPVGFWAHKRQEESQVNVYLPGDVPEDLNDLRRSPPEQYGYELDSVFAFGETEAPQEVDWVFRGRQGDSESIRILVSESGVSGGLSFPPRRETRQPCEVMMRNVNRTKIYHTYSDARYGQHEAVWQSRGHVILLTLKPSPRTDIAWFMDLIRKMET